MRIKLKPVELEPDVWHIQSDQWETNSLLICSGDQVLICGPDFTTPYLRHIGRYRATKNQNRIHLLVTHVDFDHLRSVFNLPDATVFGGVRTASKLKKKATQTKLRRLAEEWGVAWPGEPHVDTVVEAETTTAHGPVLVRAIEAAGHTDDGLGYILPNQKLFLPGDYLSGMTYPLVTGSLREAIQTHERLLSELDRNDLRLIVPGHGNPLTPREARRIGKDDLEYLRSISETAGLAIRDGMSAGQALVYVYAIEPPRRASNDFEVFEMRTSNARAALAEARDEILRGMS